MQAWGISKDSIYNILFVIPHYEMHPPLWHLILKCFSSLNINHEIGLRIPNLLFMYSAVFLLIFKSPFPKILRLMLPFTYFLFYQYSVISRPYSIFCFALFLCAMFYKEKNEHPYKFISALSLLSLSCAYGMFFASGISIVWFIEMMRDEKAAFIKNMLKDSRIKAIFILFLLCAASASMISMSENAFASDAFIDLNKILYIIFGLPCDSLISIVKGCGLNNIGRISFMYYILGAAIYAVLFHLLKFYKAVLLFFIPYIMFLSAGSLYISVHHTGLLTVFYIFVFWCALSSSRPAPAGAPPDEALLINHCFKEKEDAAKSPPPLAGGENADERREAGPASESRNGSRENHPVCFADTPPEEGNTKCLSTKHFQDKGRGEGFENNEKLIIPSCGGNVVKWKLTKKLAALCIAIPVIIQIWWSICAYINEYRFDYWYSRSISRLIKEYSLDKYKIMSEWYINKGRDNYNLQFIPVSVNPYFGRNIFYNFNMINPEKEYLFLEILKKEDKDRLKEKFKEKGLPDVIIGDPNRLSILYGRKFLEDKGYLFFDILEFFQVYKSITMHMGVPVYIREEINTEKESRNDRKK